MSSAKKGMTRDEVQMLIDERVTTAIREVVWLMVVVTPEIVKLSQGSPEDHARFAAALDGVAESQKDDGRLAASIAATALAEALRVKAAKA
jgi:hypothetical protein